MKIRTASDIHLEFGYWEFPPLPEDKDTVCVLAGDVLVSGNKSPAFYGFLQTTCEQFKDVIYIMGNHDHWRSSIVRTIPKIERNMIRLHGEVPANLHMVNDETVVIDDVAFICSTLWTDYGKEDQVMMWDAGNGGMDGKGLMTDFKRIRFGSEGDPYKCKLRPVHTVAMHMRAKEYIFPEIVVQKELGRKTIVVTHHAPSLQSLNDYFRNDKMYGAYASELGWDIADAEPAIWIHGHIHDSLDYMIHNTQILCNPRGYYSDMLNPAFNPEFILEI